MRKVTQFMGLALAAALTASTAAAAPLGGDSRREQPSPAGADSGPADAPAAGGDDVLGVWAPKGTVFQPESNCTERIIEMLRLAEIDGLC